MVGVYGGVVVVSDGSRAKLFCVQRKNVLCCFFLNSSSFNCWVVRENRQGQTARLFSGILID